jgi:N-acetylglutamate synthase-like GNAT family acetyltransferase
MATATLTSCIRSLPTGEAGPQRTELDELIELSRRPWTMHIGRTPMIVRPSTTRDLPAVAQMHRRCSARSLLDRYRQGGRSPAIAALDIELRNPHAVVAFTADGSVVATASLRRDPTHGHLCAETSVLVEDAWQQRGIGGELLSHLAGVAQVAGFNELIAYPATAVPTVQRLMLEVGRTRMVPGADAHLHTYLPEAATLGLGSVRQRLAG